MSKQPQKQLTNVEREAARTFIENWLQKSNLHQEELAEKANKPGTSENAPTITQSSISKFLGRKIKYRNALGRNKIELILAVFDTDLKTVTDRHRRLSLFCPNGECHGAFLVANDDLAFAIPARFRARHERDSHHCIYCGSELSAGCLECGWIVMQQMNVFCENCAHPLASPVESMSQLSGANLQSACEFRNIQFKRLPDAVPIQLNSSEG